MKDSCTNMTTSISYINKFNLSQHHVLIHNSTSIQSPMTIKLNFECIIISCTCKLFTATIQCAYILINRYMALSFL